MNSKQTEIKKDLIEIGIGPMAKVPWGKVELFHFYLFGIPFVLKYHRILFGLF